jgi:hypothetical protein
MGLSNEVPPNTATVDAFRASLDERHARNLSDRLIKYEHNADWREAPSPAPGIRIRRQIDIERSLAASRVPVTEEIKTHNTSAASLGAGEDWLRSWQNPRLG